MGKRALHEGANSMNVVEYGKENAEVIMLLHGGGLSWWHYQAAAELLAERFHVVLPILDGHAGSDASFTTMAANAAQIIAYIDAHFAGQVLLIGGASLGGQILTEMLCQRPDICKHAVVESALAIPMKVTAALIGPAFSLSYPLIRQRWFSRLQFRSLGIAPALFELYYRDTVQIAKADMIAFMQANMDYRINDSLGQFRGRALVLAGSKEMPAMRRSARLLVKYLPGARLEILHGMRHGELSINHPQLYVHKLLELLAE